MIEPLSIEDVEVRDSQEDPSAVYLCNLSDNPDPSYETQGASGLDVRAYLKEEPRSVSILPGERKLIPTGLYFKLPTGLEMQVRPRSGLALKKGITVLNTPGTIDSDYIGEVGVVLINHSNETFIVNSGDRIAQLVLCPVFTILQFKKVSSKDKLPNTDRGSGAYGHTGI